MERLRKIIKIIVVTLVIFALLTVVLAAIISFTSFKESWSNIGLVVILTLVCSISGYLIGCLFDSKGILVGLISSLITVEALFLGVQLVFLGSLTDIFPSVFYLISILFGTVFSIVGVNHNK